MKLWDNVLPHRLVLNSVLRKSSQQLHEEVEKYQIEFDIKLKEIELELQVEEDAINKKLDIAKNSFNQRLQEESEALSDLRNNVIAYIKKYQYHYSNAQLIEMYKIRKGILGEEISFLSKQINLLGEEIVLLNVRIKQLNAYANVDDILNLAHENGYDFGSPCDARTLLTVVSDKIKECENKYERQALIRLKNNIQERSEYLSTINYISWTIHNKKAFSKQLAAKRSNARADLKKTTDTLSAIYAEKETFDKAVELLSKDIRMHWVRPLAFINVDICYLENLRSEFEEEKQQRIDSHKEVCDELHHLASMHSDDKSRWDRLQRDREDLSFEIDELKNKISNTKKELSDKKAEAGYWYDVRKQIFQLCWENKAPLRSDRDSIPNDEEYILSERLKVIAEIRNQGIVDARNICDKKRSEINADYEQKMSVVKSLLSKTENEQKTANDKLKELKSKLESSRKILDTLKKNDDRNFFVKLLTDTQEISAAKAVIDRDKQAIAAAESVLLQMTNSVKELDLQKSMINKTYQDKLAQCKPIYLRPTEAEKLEEKKILLRIRDIGDKRKR